MPDERFARTKLALQFIQTGGIIVAVVSLFLSYFAFKDEHEWKRRQFTAEMLANFNNQIKDHRVPMMQAFPGLHNTAAGLRPSLEECRKVTKAKKGEHMIGGKFDAFEIRGHMVSAFNYFEHVAFAYEHHLGLQDEIRDSFAAVILRWHDFFLNCVRAVAEEMNGEDPWPPLTRVTNKWRSDRAKQMKDIDKTGG